MVREEKSSASEPQCETVSVDQMHDTSFFRYVYMMLERVSPTEPDS